MSDEEQSQSTEVVGIQQEHSGFMASVNRCIASKPGWEWRALLASYTTFYLFMAAWFAFHLHIMHSMMPGWGIEEVSTYNLNKITLAEPRNIRFMMNGIACASEGTINNGLYPNPWSQEEVELTRITVSSGETREASQQLRILNNFNLRFIQDTDIPVKCSITDDDNTGAYFADFFDPWATERNDPNWGTGPFGPNELTALTASNASVVVDGSSSGAGNVETSEFTFTWKAKASAPHIVEYKIKATAPGKVRVKCNVEDTQAIRKAYYFFEPHDQEFEFGFDEQDKTSYSVTFEN